MDSINELNGVSVQGHIKIYDPSNGEIFVQKRNAIHYENMSLALAESLANQGEGFVNSMVFGNGGTSVDPTGIITYLSPNSTGTNASLYSQTYTKIIDDNSKKDVLKVFKKICNHKNVSYEISNLHLGKYKEKMKFQNKTI